MSLLERVQRRFLKSLYFKQCGVYPAQGFSHSHLLELFNVDSLGVRRNQAFMRFLFKLLHNDIDAPQLLSEINFLVPRTTARVGNTFYCTASRTNIMLRSPVQGMCSC
jgi:hypothetical protein